MATARDLIKNKNSSQILSVSPEASVYEAVKLMAENNVGAVLVTADADKVEGILTERDVIRKVDAGLGKLEDVMVRDVMTSKVLYVESSQPVEECMEIMISKNIRHLPVYENGALLGLVSIRDVLKQVILEQKSMISHLEKYISGF